MTKAAWITLLYGILILVGGVIGHIKAASASSLTMGALFGILLLMSAAGMFKNELFQAYLGILLILVLDAFFLYRWLYTFSLVPAGVLWMVTNVVLAAVIIFIRKDLKNQRRKL